MVETEPDRRERGPVSLHRRHALLLAAGAGMAVAWPRAAAAAPAGDDVGSHDMRPVAVALLEQVSAPERERLFFGFDAVERHRWSYFPGRRPGLRIAEMGQKTRALAFALLRAGLSDTGYAKAHGVMKLAAILRQRRHGGVPVLSEGEGSYVLALFGDPGGDGPWGWRMEGHHLSLNYTLWGDRVLSVTPQCICADPAEVVDGPFAGLAVLDRENYMGRDLARSLDAAQFSRAVLAGPVPDNIIAGPGLARPQVREGLSHAELTDETQRHVMVAIADAWFMNLPGRLYRAELARLQGPARDELDFRWVGGFELSDLHYYRLSGPTLHIEYATRRRSDHVHALWRDLANDFGRQALRARGYAHLPPEAA